MSPRILGLALCALVLVQASAPAQEPPQPRKREIVVAGVGEASGRPDLAVTDLTVLRNAATAREALDAANAAMREVTAALRGMKIEERDLQTSGFSITPQYRYENTSTGTQAPPVLTGYEVRNTLTVRIRDLSAVGAILDKAVSLGVNQGGNISFTLADPAPLRTAARRSAVEDATETARALAEAAGVTLGSVVSITAGSRETSPLPFPRLAMAASDAGGGVPVAMGENTVRESVEVVFEIAGGG